MSKRYTAIFTAFFFFFSMFPLLMTKTAYAYQNSSYFNDVKVGLVSMSSASTKLTLNGDYTINGQTYPSGSVFSLTLSGTSIMFNGVPVSQISITPNSASNLLSITTGTVTNKYMGSFLIKVLNGSILPINMIDMESYLKGVVGYEMSDSYPLEALKAQAVAARNYAISRLGWEAAKGYDFDDTINYQVYKGFNSSYTNVISSVEQTRGQVLLYNDTLVETLYSAWHGGISENSENVWGNYVPYLRSVVDTYENNPWPNGNVVLTNAQVQSALVAKGYLLSTDSFIKLDLSSITKFPSGRVSNINIIYKNASGQTITKSVTKDSTRTFLSLPSNLYNVTYDSISGSYTFSGKGYGHGLGMSQIGAKNRAAAGQTYDQILKFYYQNVYLQNLILKASISSFSQTLSSLLTGNTISFSAIASGGNGFGYLYKYIVKSGSNTIYTRDYSSSSSFDYIPANPGNYTIEAYVKDRFSISDYDDIKTSSFTVYAQPAITSYTLSKSTVLVGQAISAALSAQSGSGSYLYKYETSKDGSIIDTRDFSSDSTYNYVPSSPGNYTITAYIKDSISGSPYDCKQAQTFTACSALTLASYSKDILNVFTGDTVNFSSTVSGGSGNGVNYKYVILKDNQQVTTRDYSSGSSFTFTPTSSGSYEADLYAVDAISNNTYDIISKLPFTVKDRASITSYSADKSSLLVSDPVTLNAAGNTPGALYKFVLTKDGTVVYTKDYDISPTLAYTPTQAGNYQAAVYTKDPLSLKDCDDTKALNFTVYDYPAISSFSSDKAQLFKNNAINFTAAGTRGSGNLLYKFVISKDNNVIAAQDYSSLNTFSFTPVLEGNYSAAIYLKDALSAKNYDDTNNLAFTVLYDAKIATSQSNKSQYLAGQTINVNTTGTSGSGNYLYKHVVAKDGTTLSTIDFSSNGNLQYTTDSSGTYTISEYMKDVLSSKDYDDVNTLTLPVYNKPSINMTGTVSACVTGTAVTYSINEINGSGKAQYRFVVMMGSNTIADSGFTDSNTFSNTCVNAGNYQITGYIKDAASDNSYDAQSTLNLSVYSPQLGLVTASGYLYEGKAITLNSNSVGASPSGFYYRYEVYYNGNLTASNSFSTASSFTFTPQTAGNYIIKVYGKDGLSNNSYDSLKQFTLTIAGKPLFLSALPLSYGMTSNDVTSLQNALINLGYALSGATGYFGTQTKSAVISFQTSKGLSADGIVGNMTYSALNDALIVKTGIKTLNY